MNKAIKGGASSALDLVMGLAFFPLSKILSKMRVHEDAVTIASLFAALIGSALLVVGGNPVGFAISWFISVGLDFSDGQIARLNGRANSSALHLDHTMDLLKISLISTAIGIYYSDTTAWVLVMTALAAFLVHVNLNSQLNYALATHSSKGCPPAASRDHSSAVSAVRLVIINLVTVNSFTVLFLMVAPLSHVFLILSYGYLGVTSLIMSTRSAIKLGRLPRR